MGVQSNEDNKTTMNSNDQGSSHIIALIQAQATLATQVAVIDQRQKTSDKEQERIYNTLEEIRKNMATKDDIQAKQKQFDEIEKDLKEDITHTNASVKEMHSSFMAAIAKIMAKLDKTAESGGENMVETAVLTGKFTIFWAILMVIVSGIIGGAITFWFARGGG